jgi:hypothetical protein
VPARKGTVPFTWRGPADAALPAVGQVPVEAIYQRAPNGFVLGYTLTATADRSRMGRDTLGGNDLRGIRIHYRDDRMEASRPDAAAVEGLIAEIYQINNRACWEGQAVVPGGECIGFSEPMRKLMMIGPAAREALHRRLDDRRIQGEVVMVLGAVGDETTVPLLIGRYPERLSTEDPLQRQMVYFSFALSYLTGQAIDRTREGTTLSADNAGRWRAWWAEAGPTFRVPAVKPNATWVPSYPVLTEDWATRMREQFANGNPVNW